jgi:hypothetical protein
VGARSARSSVRPGDCSERPGDPASADTGVLDERGVDHERGAVSDPAERPVGIACGALAEVMPARVGEPSGAERGIGRDEASAGSI